MPDPNNTPGDRAGATTWVDAHGDLRMSGGTIDLNNANDFGDLWEYVP